MRRIRSLVLMIALLARVSQCIFTVGILETLENFFSGFPEPSDMVNDQLYMDEEYDFIVVGAGSGGCVITNRLTEKTEWQVLLLEAGKDEIFLTDVPLIAPVLHITDYNWGYRSEPSSRATRGLPGGHREGGYCLAMKDARCHWARGKAVGGSSVVNFMIYSRGSPSDFDEWAALGNPGWTYKDLLPYFIKSENSKLVEQDVRFHGVGGYLDVTISPYESVLREPFLEAGQELGYDVVDYNSDRIVGFSKAHVNLRYGRRVSANKAFLRPIRNRPNFHLSKFSRVVKLNIDPRSKRAIGVEFLKNGRRYSVKARKEIILSAGALSSPQLLMLAGIGPRDHLESLGINVLEDLPVGYNLQDHVSMSALTFLVNDSVTIVEPRLISNPLNTIDYLFKGTGPFTSAGGADGIAFINTKRDVSQKQKTRFSNSARPNNLKNYDEVFNVSAIKLDPGYILNSNLIAGQGSWAEVPDAELVLGLSSLTGDISGGWRGLLGLSDEFIKDAFEEYMGYDGFSIVPIVLRPKSRGRVSLRSKNPLDDPIFQPNYYEHPEDLATMVRAIKKGIEVASTKAFKRFNATLLPKPFLGCKHLPFKSDAYWACVSRHVSTTLGHMVGTCTMAPRAAGGVVDSRLRVYGIQGLRVVDAGIIPIIVRGHTNAPVYMIAEKAADLIKEDYGRKYY